MSEPSEIGPANIQKIEDEDSSIKGIPGDQAVQIASKDALKTYKSLDDFKVVLCEQEIFWRVIFDGGGPEYLIDKLSGNIVRTQKTVQGTEAADTYKERNYRSGISEAEAVAIAKRDMMMSANSESFDGYIVHACELRNSWRVIIEPKIRLRPTEKVPVIPNASTPNYVIDKYTGKILFKQR